MTLISSWVAPPVASTRWASPQLAAAEFESEGWRQLQGKLDQLPVFTVANAEGQPLQYEINQRPLAVFYADVEAAKKELAAAQSQYPELSCDLIPVGLGSAYKLSCDGSAMVVPSLASLQALGAPEGAQPMGQELPLFACMEMSQEGENGPVLPLYMSHEDCAAVIKKVTEADPPDEPLQISGLSLPSVVERLTSLADPAKGGFAFVAPSASLQHIQAYVGQGVYWRPAEE